MVHFSLAVLNHARMLLDCQQATESKGCTNETILTSVVLGFSGGGKSSFVDRLVCHSRDKSYSNSTGAVKKAIRVQVPKSPHPASKKCQWKLQETVSDATAVVAEKVFFNILDHPEPKGKLKSLGHLEPGEMPSKDKLAYYGSSPSGIATPYQAVSSCFEVSEKFLPTGKKVRQPAPPFRRAEETWTHFITETGGLPQFQKLFPNVVSRPSLFYYVFRADEKFDGKLQGCYRESGTESPIDDFTGTTTKKEAILQFLASVAALKVPDGHLKVKITPPPPKVLFIATHVDTLKSMDQVTEIDQELQKIVKSTQAFEDGMIVTSSASCMLFAVNNLAKDDACFQAVRSAVEKIAEGASCFPVPYTWSLFSVAVQHLPGPVLSFKKCLEFGKQCGIKSQGEMGECLLFLHHIGVVCYFKGILDVVFKDPQYLYDKLTDLVVSTLKASKVPSYPEKGIFTLENLQHLLSVSGVLKFAQLVQLLQRLCVVASLCNSHFLPCSLFYAVGTEPTDSASSQSRLPHLLFTFERKHSPEGLAEAFVAKLLHSKYSDFAFKEVAVNHNQVSVSVAPHSDKFLFIFNASFIRVQVFLSDEVGTRECSEAAVCCKLRERVSSSLLEVIKQLGLHPTKCTHQAAFDCPNKGCRAEPHFAVVTRSAEGSYCLQCSRSEQPITLPHDHLVWYVKVSSTGIAMHGTRAGVIYNVPCPTY